MTENALQNGTKLKDRYLIQKVIGTGGFGVIYEAFDLLLNRNVAIKEFFVEGCMTRDKQNKKAISVNPDEDSIKKISRCRKMFLHEIKIMELIQNVPYITRIKDNFAENGTEYIVMNLLQGMTLSEYAKKHGGRIKTSILLKMLKTVMLALEEMHRLQVIHRDISPGNLFLTEDEDLYLIDFGGATSFNNESELYNPQVIEHIGFHAPEYENTALQGAWTDIYSLSATIVYLITGEGVPTAENRSAFDALPQMLMRSKLSNKQQNAIMLGMKINPQNRYDSIDKFRTELYGEEKEEYVPKNVLFGAGTHIGSKNVNQDNLMVDGLFYYEGTDFIKSGKINCESDTIHVVGVCDGVSGANSGELASRAVAQALDHFVDYYRNSDVLPERLLEELLDQINEKIIILGEKIGKTATTVSFLLWQGNEFYAVNIGDSPIFLLRKWKLSRLSTPHTLATTKQMEGKEITLRDNHVLMNFVGKRDVAGSQIAAYHHGYLKKGDTFFLCTDGITDKIDRDRLKMLLLKSENSAIKSMFKIVKTKQNVDNCSGIVLKFN